MTFEQLREIVRRDIIADEFTDAFTDENIDEALWLASVEVAAAYDFPREIRSIALSAGASFIPLPERCLRVHTVMINGDDLRSVDIQQLIRLSGGVNRPSRYFNFDPRRGYSLLISPNTTGGTAVVEFTQGIMKPDPIYLGEVWGGLLPHFHTVVAYRAAATLFQQDERENETEYWTNQYNLRAQELAAFLGRTDFSSLIVEKGLRNDAGAAG